MKILIIKTSAIGDVIQAFPVIEYLRLCYPDAQIDWVVEKPIARLIAAHPSIHRTVAIDTKKWRKEWIGFEARKEIAFFVKTLRSVKYDLLFDLQGNTKSALVTLCARAQEKVGFGLRSVPEILNLLATRQRYEVPKEINVRLRYLKIVQSHLKDSKPFFPSGVVLNILPEEEKQLDHLLKGLPRPVYMVCFGSKWRNKQLEETTLLSYLQQVVAKKNPYFLFIFGGKEEKEVAERLTSAFLKRSSALGNMSLPLWQALMSRVDLVIAMDSAALHLCGTTSTPSFSIFGPSKGSIYKPLGDQHLSLQGSCPYNRTFVHRCALLRTCSTGACMRALTPEQIVAFQSRDDSPQSQLPHAPSQDPLA